MAANVAAATAQFAGSPDDRIDIPTFATDEALWAAHPDFLGKPASWFRQVCWRVGEQLDADVTFRFES